MSAVDQMTRSAIRRIRPYRPGKPIQEVEREYGIQNAVKLASNENPLGPSPLAIAAMREAAAEVGFYPEDTCYYLKRDLAAHLDMPEETILLGNGSDEVLHCAGLTFLNPGDNTIIPTPSFVMYETNTLLNDCEPRFVPLRDFKHDLDAMLERVDSRTKLFYVCNPNNPTGTYLSGSEIERLMDRLPETCLLILDEAYNEYADAPDYPKSLNYVRQERNVLVARTFSKIYALAGLRIGYGIARPDIIGALMQTRPPFNVNTLAQTAALASLADPDQVPRGLKCNGDGKLYFYEQLERRGLSYEPTQANFIFMDTERDARQAGEELLCRGVIIRVGDWIFNSPSYIRVTIGTPEQNRRFFEALDEVLVALPPLAAQAPAAVR